MLGKRHWKQNALSFNLIKAKTKVKVRIHGHEWQVSMEEVDCAIVQTQTFFGRKSFQCVLKLSILDHYHENLKLKYQIDGHVLSNIHSESITIQGQVETCITQKGNISCVMLSKRLGKHVNLTAQVDRNISVLVETRTPTTSNKLMAKLFFHKHSESWLDIVVWKEKLHFNTHFNNLATGFTELVHSNRAAANYGPQGMKQHIKSSLSFLLLQLSPKRADSYPRPPAMFIGMQTKIHSHCPFSFTYYFSLTTMIHSSKAKPIFIPGNMELFSLVGKSNPGTHYSPQLSQIATNRAHPDCTKETDKMPASYSCVMRHANQSTDVKYLVLHPSIPCKFLHNPGPHQKYEAIKSRRMSWNRALEFCEYHKAILPYFVDRDQLITFIDFVISLSHVYPFEGVYIGLKFHTQKVKWLCLPHAKFWNCSLKFVVCAKCVF